MGFEEQFPSLNNSYIDKQERVHCLSIINHCLDKQRVKKTIERRIESNTKVIVRRREVFYKNEVLRNLLKELGLED